MSDKDETEQQQDLIRQGRDDVMSVIMQIADKAGSGSLDGFPAIFDELDAIVERTGIEVPGHLEQMAALREGTAKSQDHFSNYDAAMWAGDLERANTLLEQRPDVDQAAMMGNFAPLESDVTDFDEDDHEETDLAALAKEMGIDISEFDPPLPDQFSDIAEGAPGAIENAIAAGIDLNLSCGDGRHTALLAALDAPGRRVEHLRKLVEAGADPLFIHAEGDSALSWAQGYNHPETVTKDSEIAVMTYLAEQGCDPNFRGAEFWTPLHRSIVQGDLNRVAAMLATKPDLEIDMFETFSPEFLRGVTPLMLAAPKPDVVELLLEAGADAVRPDSKGRNQCDWLASQLDDAHARADDADPWTVEFPQKLAKSLELMRHSSTT